MICGIDAWHETYFTRPPCPARYRFTLRHNAWLLSSTLAGAILHRPKEYVLFHKRFCRCDLLQEICMMRSKTTHRDALMMRWLRAGCYMRGWLKVRRARITYFLANSESRRRRKYSRSARCAIYGEPPAGCLLLDFQRGGVAIHKALLHAAASISQSASAAHMHKRYFMMRCFSARAGDNFRAMIILSFARRRCWQRHRRLHIWRAGHT